LRHVRAARTRNTTPKRICDQETPSAAELSDTASPATYARPLTRRSAAAHPRRNIGPLAFALLEKSMRITAMMGTGLIATPTA
jgi:hypothetical protein